MSKLRFNITMSLDGFVAGPDQSDSVVPLFLGEGSRLFDNLGDAKLDLEQVEAVEAPGVAHVRYRVSRG
jgi:hypothetical protein